MFQRRLLFPSSAPQTEVAGSPETLVFFISLNLCGFQQSSLASVIVLTCIH